MPLLLLCLGCSDWAAAQQKQVITLRNPSFEDVPTPGTIGGRVHRNWMDCGKMNESVPDIQPSPNPDDPYFEVITPAFEGTTYLGMVVRDNDTYEGLSQRLQDPIQKGKVYTFSIHLAKSLQYISDARGGIPGQKTNHNKPIKLQIWGGNNYCQKQELLAESPLIKHTEWQQYDFRFEPKGTFLFISIMAFYKTPTLVPYNGNILVDNASPIVEIDPDQLPRPVVNITSPFKNNQKALKSKYLIRAKVENVTKEKNIQFLVNKKPVRFRFDRKKGTVTANAGLLEGVNSIEIRASNKSGNAKAGKSIFYEPALAAVSPEPRKNEPEKKPESYNKKPMVHIPQLGENLRKGQEIRIEKLYFDIDSASIRPQSVPILEELYYFMKTNPEVIVEIGGHTNNRCDSEFCNKLSEARAKSVVEFLNGRGITENQLKYKGYGKRKPVATNATPTGRKRNQRVEIKILSLDG